MQWLNIHEGVRPRMFHTSCLLGYSTNRNRDSDEKLGRTRNNLQCFLNDFPCLPAPARPNTTPLFSLVDASRPPLQPSPSTLNPTAWAILLNQYPGPLRYYLPMILRFGTQLGYEGKDVFMISKNLASALENPHEMDRKLATDLALNRIARVLQPTSPFISSPLGIVPKPHGGLRRIHHLSFPPGTSVDANIPKSDSELRYTSFDEMLEMIRQAGRNCVILKRDVKDAFRNIPVAPHCQWLLGFMWNDEFFKELCLSFGLSTAPFIFNLFGEGIHWILQTYLRWKFLCHYLDDFIVIFPAIEATTKTLTKEKNAYICLTDIMGIPRNDLKDIEGLIVTVFGIEVDTTKFVARMPEDKLEKALKATTKILFSDSVALMDIQSLVGFLSFCAKVVRSAWVFMRHLLNFVAYSYPRTVPKTMKRRIPFGVRQDLIWWNRFLPDFNGVLFFDKLERENVILYTDATLEGLGGFFYKNDKRSWEHVTVSEECAFISKVQHLEPGQNEEEMTLSFTEQ